MKQYIAIAVFALGLSAISTGIWIQCGVAPGLCSIGFSLILLTPLVNL